MYDVIFQQNSVLCIGTNLDVIFPQNSVLCIDQIVSVVATVGTEL